MAENVVNDILKWLETQLQRNEGIKIDTIAIKVATRSGICNVFLKILKVAH